MTSKNTDELSASKTPDRTQLRRVLASAAIGQFVEWYDFVVYAYSATVIATLFFPAEDRVASLLAVFAVYAAGFVMRPLGAIIFGHIGDTAGRRNVLSAVILIMGGATVAIGLLPTYGQVGVIATVLLVVCRLAQGLSAGAETTGSNTLVAEHAPAHRRGLAVAFTLSFSTVPAVFASLLILLLLSGLGSDAYGEWGWRVPFLLGGVFALVGLYIRQKVDESPEFQATRKGESPALGGKRSFPLWTAIKESPRAVFYAFALASLSSLGFYTLTGYLPTYLSETVNLDQGVSLASNAIALLAVFFAMPLTGLLSDRIGRKPVLIAGAALSAIVAVPAYLLASNGTAVGAISGQLLLALAISVFFGPFGVAFIELFPVKNRLSGAGIGYNAGYVLFGGTAPYVSTWLVQATGDLLAPAYYMLVVAALVAVVTFALPKAVR